MEDIKENINQPLNTPVNTPVNSNSHKKILIVSGIVSLLLIVSVLMSFIQSQQNLTYKPEAKEQKGPTHIRIEVSPVPINTADDLDRALNQLESADANSFNTIQSQINQINITSAQ